MGCNVDLYYSSEMSYNEEFWWEELDEFFIDFAFDAGLEEENYLGKVFLITIDKNITSLEKLNSKILYRV